MKLGTGLRGAVAMMLACAVVAAAGEKKEKTKTIPARMVDSGSFGVFVKGQRVLTETFSVEQSNGNSTIKSELKEAKNTSTPDQKSRLEISAGGELVRYEWSEGGPEGGALVVVPNNEFLLERITTSASAKAAEQPFLMPNTSMILDNNFFVQREVLAWRYLAAACKPQNGAQQCQKEAAEFGALVPQDRNSMRVRIELVGKEKVALRGVERELLRLNLTGEGFEWALWVDDQDQFKLMRVAIPADSTEIVRD